MKLFYHFFKILQFSLFNALSFWSDRLPQHWISTSLPLLELVTDNQTSNVILMLGEGVL